MEKDPNGIAAKTPGSKLDAGKPPVWQGALDYFPRAIEAVAALSAAGAAKYTWKGWESVPDGIARYRNAQGRHITAEAKEGIWDSQMGSLGYPTLHLTQQVWNSLAALELMLKDRDNQKEVDFERFQP